MRFFTDLLREINDAETRGNLECDQMNNRRDIEEEYDRTVEAQKKYLNALNALSTPEAQQKSYVNEEWKKRTQLDSAETTEHLNLTRTFNTEAQEIKWKTYKKKLEMEELSNAGWVIPDRPKK